MNLGFHSGANFALNRYSDSIWYHREAQTNAPRHIRLIGPAPNRAPLSSAERKAAKFNDRRRTPNSGAAFTAATIIASLRPASA
jgi:hypothetical protein